MESVGQLEQDLHHIAAAVRRRDAEPGPAGITLMWAALVLVGFPLGDLRPEWAGLFWAVCGPLGGVASWLLARRHARRTGTWDSAEGRTALLHFGGLVAFWAFIPFLIRSQNLRPEGAGQVALLIVAVVYYLGWVHFHERGLLLAAGVMAGACVALAYLHQYVWTATGVAVAMALVVGSFRRRREASPPPSPAAPVAPAGR
jgi:hypothetical protein